jgi:uncharacterized membrane protein
MKPSVKSAIESAALALLISMVCLWFLISGNRAAFTHQAATMAFLAIGLAVSIVLHLVFVGFAVQRDGRPLGGWLALSVLLFPVGSIITLVLVGWLSAESERERAQPQA